jgi:small subunit ribosomal protein S6
VKEYETVFILHPKVDDAGIEKQIASFKQTVSDGQGEMVGVHKWGRRKLAYQIRKANEGFYVLARFRSNPEVLVTLDRKFKIDETVLRYLTVMSPGDAFPPDLKGRERRGYRGDGPGGPRGRGRGLGPRGRRGEGRDRGGPPEGDRSGAAEDDRTAPAEGDRRPAAQAAAPAETPPDAAGPTGQPSEAGPGPETQE